MACYSTHPEFGAVTTLETISVHFNMKRKKILSEQKFELDFVVL